MPTPAQNAQIRNAAFGFQTNRAAAVVPTVAQSPQTIFTVAGGKILVKALIGEITTVFDATVYTLKVTASPTGGTPTDLSAALTMTSFAAGVHVTLGATVGAALTHDSTALAGFLFPMPQALLVNVGALTLTGSATQTGAMKWSLYWVALDPAASVVAA